MAGLKRTIHPVSNFKYGPLTEIAPDVHLQAGPAPPAGNGDGQAPPPKALAFTDPDGEAHVYIFTDEGRENLIRALTGGVILPAQFPFRDPAE